MSAPTTNPLHPPSSSSSSSPPNPHSHPPPTSFLTLTTSERAHLIRIIKTHLKFFLACLAGLQGLEAVRSGLRSRSTSRSRPGSGSGSKGGVQTQPNRPLPNILQIILNPLPSNIRTALFLAIYPAVFRLFNVARLRESSQMSFLRDPPTFGSRSSSGSGSGSGSSTTTTTTANIDNERSRPHPHPRPHPGILRSARINIQTPTLLLAPLSLLLPLGWLNQLNLYSTTAAGLAGARYLSGRIEEGERFGLAWLGGEGGQDVELESEVEVDERWKGYRPYWIPPTPKTELKDEMDLIGSSSGRAPISASALKITPPQRSKTPHRDILVKIRDAMSGGGSWWLFSLSQGWLLYTAVFEGDCFPSSYRKGIISRSRRYVPTTQSLHLPAAQASLIPHPSSILSLLPVFAHSPYPHPAFPLPRLPGIKTQYASFLTLFDVAHGDHTRAMCSVLHPLEPSCMKNYVEAVGDALPSALALIGGWSGLTTLLRWKKFSRNPAAAFVKWMKATVRGAAMIALSISTAWVWVCAFQRILSPTTLPRARFAIGGILAGCWIVLVPSTRRLELGMYTFRLSLASLWKVGLKKGWWKYRPSMRFLPFALAMTLLTYIKRRDAASVNGWVGRTVKYLDQEVDSLKKKDGEVGKKTGV